MTVAALTELFLMNLGYARSDTAEPDVVEEYSGVMMRWLNEGYLRAVRRVCGRAALKNVDLLRADEDEPVKLEESLHPLLADYAAARGQEVRGNTAAASALYAAFERGISEACAQEKRQYRAWEAL